MPQTEAQLQTAFLARLMARGGIRLSAYLRPDDAALFQAWKRDGEPVGAAIMRAIRAARQAKES